MALYDYTGFASCDGVFLGEMFAESDHHGKGQAHFVLGALNDHVQIVGRKTYATLFVDGVEVDLDTYEITRQDFVEHGVFSDADEAYVGQLGAFRFEILRWDDRIEATLTETRDLPLNPHQWYGEAHYGD